MLLPHVSFLTCHVVATYHVFHNICCWWSRYVKCYMCNICCWCVVTCCFNSSCCDIIMLLMRVLSHVQMTFAPSFWTTQAVSCWQVKITTSLDKCFSTTSLWRWRCQTSSSEYLAAETVKFTPFSQIHTSMPFYIILLHRAPFHTLLQFVTPCSSSLHLAPVNPTLLHFTPFWIALPHLTPVLSTLFQFSLYGSS